MIPPVEVSSEFGSFLEAYIAAWNTHDGDVLANFFTLDADLIMGNLPRRAGRNAIAGWWKTYFSRINEGRKGEFEPLSFQDIAPDVWLVNVSSKTFGTDENGGELEPRFARGTWVVVKRHAALKIVAMRGHPAVGKNRQRPGTDR